MKDEDDLQGKWTVTAVMSGSPQKDKQVSEIGIVFEFKADTLFRYEKGIRQDDSVNFKLDPAKKPKTIDLYPFPKDKTKAPLLGIYAINGDQLKISWSKIDGQFRPESFELAEKNRTRQITFVLQRVKEKKLDR